jgi:hypothetical protein
MIKHANNLFIVNLKFRFIPLLLALALMVSCGEEKEKKDQDIKSLKHQFPLAADFSYNQFIESNDKLYQGKYLKAIFSGQEYYLKFDISNGCDTEGYLKKVRCYIGSINESGIWESNLVRKPLSFKDFAFEFQSKYDLIPIDSHIGQISEGIGKKLLKLHELKIKYVSGYEGSDEMLNDIHNVYVWAGKKYFKSSDQDLFIEIWLEPNGKNIQNWKVNELVYQSMGDWMDENLRYSESLDKEIARTISLK